MRTGAVAGETAAVFVAHLLSSHRSKANFSSLSSMIRVLTNCTL